MSSLRLNFRVVALTGAIVLTLTGLTGTVSFEKAPYLRTPSIFETYDFGAKENDEKRKRLSLKSEGSKERQQRLHKDARVKLC